jgi:hypothetical protein
MSGSRRARIARCLFQVPDGSAARGPSVVHRSGPTPTTLQIELYAEALYLTLGPKAVRATTRQLARTTVGNRAERRMWIEVARRLKELLAPDTVG